MRRTNFSRMNRAVMVALVLGLCVACQNQDQGQQGADLTPYPPGTLDFGDVLLWTSSPPEAVAWKNAGSQSVEVSGVRISQNEAVFSAQGGFTAADVAPDRISPLANVVFTPNKLGQDTGAAKAVARDPTGTSRPSVTPVPLQGNGVAQVSKGNLNIGGGSITAGQVLDFGDVRVSATSTAQTFVISNTASATSLIVTAQWSRGAQGFAILPPNNLPITIPPNTTMTITVSVTFTPPQVGEFADSVRFMDASGNHVAGTAVRGNGVKGE